MAYGIGIDTSCYTTSFCMVDLETEEIVLNYQQLLQVKRGERGLRQSAGFYQHVQNLGQFFSQCPRHFFKEVAYVAVSHQPRHVEGSYMPVFTAGLQFAETLAATLDTKLYKTDHQSGHLSAAFYGYPKQRPKTFIGLHLSGGTTEILACREIQTTEGHIVFDCDVIGGSLDISVGQLIDRLGVFLGFDFPCGKAMEASISNTHHKSLINSFPKIQDQAYFNLSGCENKGRQLYEKSNDQQGLIAGVFDYISRQLLAALECILKTHPCEAIVLSGGVAANDTIANYIEDKLSFPVIRGEKRFCTDNALGVAYLPLLNK